MSRATRRWGHENAALEAFEADMDSMTTKTMFLGLSMGVLALALPQSAFAAPANAGRAAKRAERREARQTLGRYDTNHNGQIDEDEREGLRKAFDSFKSLDKNNDGKLEDSEIAEVKTPSGRKASKAGRHGRRRQKPGQNNEENSSAKAPE